MDLFILKSCLAGLESKCLHLFPFQKIPTEAVWDYS